MFRLCNVLPNAFLPSRCNGTAHMIDTAATKFVTCSAHHLKQSHSKGNKESDGLTMMQLLKDRTTSSAKTRRQRQPSRSRLAERQRRGGRRNDRVPKDNPSRFWAYHLSPVQSSSLRDGEQETQKAADNLRMLTDSAEKSRYASRPGYAVPSLLPSLAVATARATRATSQSLAAPS